MAKNRTGVRGLYLKAGRYVYQPPMVKGVRGKPVFLQTADFTKAVQLVDEIKRANFVRQQTRPLDELVNAYLVAKIRHGEHKGQITTLSAKPGIDRFAAFMKCQADQVTPERIRAWKASMLDEGLSRASVAGYMRYAQSFCSWLKREGELLSNPFEGQKALFPKSIPTKREEFCSKEERDQLIRNCEFLPLKAVLFIGFHAGLRRNEILNIRPDWIIKNGAGRPLYFHVQNERNEDGDGLAFTVKDSEAKMVPITEPLADFLVDEYGLDHSPFLIRPDMKPGKNKYRWEWKKRWATYMKGQGLEWVTVHTMRHTWFTLLLSAPPEVRPSLLHLERWSGTNTETIKKNYAHLLEDRNLINAAN